jgi:ABC-type sugar transport system ATPase subunit
VAGPDQVAAGVVDGVGHAVVLAGLPDDRVGVVLAAVVDGHPDPKDQGGLALGDIAMADVVEAVGGHAEGGVEPVEGLLGVADAVALEVGVGVAELVGQAGVVVAVADVQVAGRCGRWGALLDARAVHGGRSARDHLRWLARSNRIPARRVEEVLGLVGLDQAAGCRVRGFSLGMSQRLGIAAALLGDPGVLLFDEPANGLDTEGIAWVRAQLRAL